MNLHKDIELVQKDDDGYIEMVTVSQQNPAASVYLIVSNEGSHLYKEAMFVFEDTAAYEAFKAML